MNGTCVISIAEVLIELLQQPQLHDELRRMKSELMSIVNIQVRCN